MHLQSNYHYHDELFLMSIFCMDIKMDLTICNYDLDNSSDQLIIMPVAMITMINYLTNIFTWEGFLLLSIDWLKAGKTRCSITKCFC